MFGPTFEGKAGCESSDGLSVSACNIRQSSESAYSAYNTTYLASVSNSKTEVSVAVVDNAEVHKSANPIQASMTASLTMPFKREGSRKSNVA